MEIKAKLNHLHIAPRKVRLVANLVRGMPVEHALRELSVLLRRPSGPLLKLLRSALANAKQNFQLEEGGLYVKSLVVNPGPVSKRFRARAFGRAAPLRKRTSHVSLVLDVKEGVVVETKKKRLGAGPKIRELRPEDVKEDFVAKPREERGPDKKITKTKSVGFVRRMFRRKAI